MVFGEVEISHRCYNALCCNAFGDIEAIAYLFGETCRYYFTVAYVSSMEVEEDRERRMEVQTRAILIIGFICGI